jgi:apolipoprotein N-acyltransferase
MTPSKNGTSKVKRFAFAFLSAFLVFCAFPPLSLWWLLPVALAPFYIAVKSARPFESAFVSYCTGFLLFSLVCYWLAEVTLAGLFVAAFIAAFYYLGFGVAATLLRHQKKIPLSVVAAAVWCVMEFLRSKLFWLAFPWALIPHPLYEQTILIQAAELFGVWGYSFIIPLLNFALAEILLSFARRERVKIGQIITVVLIIILVPLYGLIRLPSVKTEPSLRVLIVQGNIPQNIKEEAIQGMRRGVSAERILNLAEYMLSSHLALTHKGLQEAGSVELVVWPETMVPGSLFESPDRYVRVASFVKRSGVPLFLGTERRSGKKRLNSAALIMPDGSVKDVYDKMVLVPVGEYIPARSVFPLFATVIENMMPYETEDLSEGERLTIFELNGKRFACLICFELSFCELVRQAIKSGAEVIVNISNDAWFGRSTELELAVAQAVFRAVEARRPVLRAVNAGISCYVSPEGYITYLEKDGEKKQVEGVLAVKVETSRIGTIYLVAGDYIPYICILLVVVSALFHLIKNKESHIVGR